MDIVILIMDDILTVFKEFVIVLIPRLFNFFPMMFVVELLHKIIYVNELLLEKLLSVILGKNLQLWILKDFILARYTKKLRYWSSAKDFFLCFSILWF